MLKLRARAAAPTTATGGRGMAAAGVPTAGSTAASAPMSSARAHALDARERGSPAGDDGAGHWVPPVITAVATEGKAIPEVMAALDAHYEYLSSTGKLTERRRARLRERVRDVVHQRVRSRLWSDPDTATWLDERLPALESGRSTPYEVADALLRRSAALLTGRSE